MPRDVLVNQRHLARTGRRRQRLATDATPAHQFSIFLDLVGHPLGVSLQEVCHVAGNLVCTAEALVRRSIEYLQSSNQDVLQLLRKLELHGVCHLSHGVEQGLGKDLRLLRV